MSRSLRSRRSCQALAAYLTERELPSKTELEVRATFTRFLASCGGDKAITEVRKDDVRKFREYLLSDSAKSGKGKGSLAPATIRKYLNLLGTVFQHAVRTGTERQTIEEELAELPAQIANHKRELAATPMQDKERRENLVWRIRRDEKRTAELRARLARAE